MAATRATQQQGAPGAPDPRSVRRKNRQVWDMVDHLVHPTAIYVVLQLLILSHLSRSELLVDRHGLHPTMLAIYAAQFAGAWAVFYTTLLRDMGMRSWEGTILLLASVVGVALQYILIPEPEVGSSRVAITLLGFQLGLGLLLWIRVFPRWMIAKANTPQPEEEPS